MMKTLIIMFIAGIVLSQPGISAGPSSEDSAARDLAAAKSLAFGELELPGGCPKGSGIYDRFWSGLIPRSSCKLRSLTGHRQARFTFWLAYAGVIAPHIKRFLIRSLVPTMMLKLCADA